MAKTKVSQIKDERGFYILSLVLMAVLALFCVIPFILMISVSFSSETALAHGYKFFPEEFSLSAYSYLWLKRATIFRAYGLTILVTVVGTAVNLLITSLFAYPLSRKDFRYRNIFAFILFFTCLFNGGMTASYIVWTRLFHVKDTIWAYLLPGALMGAMNVLMVRNYYNANIPYAIIEAARIDGAGPLRVFAQVYLPLSTPIMATIAILKFMDSWNSFLWPLVILTGTETRTVPIFISAFSYEGGTRAAGSTMCVAFMGIIPVLIVFLLLQKYIIQSIALSGVKGE